MLNLNYIVSPLTTNQPQYKVVDGVNMKLESFNMTEDGLVPIYVETDEVSEEQALSIILGDEE